MGDPVNRPNRLTTNKRRWKGEFLLRKVLIPAAKWSASDGSPRDNESGREQAESKCGNWAWTLGGRTLLLTARPYRDGRVRGRESDYKSGAA